MKVPALKLRTASSQRTFMESFENNMYIVYTLLISYLINSFERSAITEIPKCILFMHIGNTTYLHYVQCTFYKYKQNIFNRLPQEKKIRGKRYTTLKIL